MQRHCDNALAVAKHLQSHPLVSWVRYPGLSEDPSYRTASEQFDNGYGGVVVFGIASQSNPAEAGAKFINSLNLHSHLANVGDARSLAIHPSSTTHSQLNEQQQAESGITPDLIRLSVGLEHIDDILEDLDQALAQ